MIEINIIIPTLNENENIILLLKDIKKNIPTASITIIDDSKHNNMEKILEENNLKKY